MVAPPELHTQSMAITGGMGGVGMQCAHALAPCTNRLLLAGRSARRPLPRLFASAALIQAVQLDVGMAADLQSLHSAQPKVVLHASGALADGVVRNLRAPLVRKVWASKASDAVLYGLHGLAMQLPMESTVLFSSVAVPIAAAGQV